MNTIQEKSGGCPFHLSSKNSFKSLYLNTRKQSNKISIMNYELEKVLGCEKGQVVEELKQ
jgi:hypothetical protein